MDPGRKAAAGRLLISILGASWRTARLRPSTGIRGNDVLYAFWHGVQLPLIYTHRNMGIRIMISRSADGTLVSSVCEAMGYAPVRGSSSRGGMEAARELIKSLRRGIPGAITPDGPRGPAGVVKKGVSLIPSRAGVPVVPYGVSAFPAVKLKSWDRFLVPLPLSRLVICEGRPVPPDRCTEKNLKRAIDQQQRRAELVCSPSASAAMGIYRLAGNLASPLAHLVMRSRPERERRERLGLISPRGDAPVWLHGASLGELNGIMPLMNRLRELDRPFHVTCSTASGRNFLESRGIDCSFMPLDIPGAVSRFLQRLSPSALILAETEFWPALLHETQRRGIPSALVNGRLSRRSHGSFRLLNSLYAPVMRCFRAVLARSGEDAARFRSLGIPAENAGDGKTLVKPQPPDAEWNQRVSRGRGGILIAGSTRKGEEEVVLMVAAELGMTPVLVPRHASRIDEVILTCRRAGLEPELWSHEPRDSSCLIVDVKGILAALYGLGDLAFIGGTLADIGGHNIMEPLAHGIPVIAGPSHWNIREELNDAVRRGACGTFRTVEEGVSVSRELLSRKENAAWKRDGDLESRLNELLEELELS